MKKRIIYLLPALSLLSLIGCNKNNEEFQLITNNSIKYLAYNGTEKVAAVVGHEDSLGSEITIPSSVNGYKVNAIGQKSFAGTSINKITLPESVVYIGDYSFTKCSNLKSVSFPNDLAHIGTGAFLGCSSLNDVDMSNTQIQLINSYCFSACDSLNNIKFSNILGISTGAFLSCQNLSSITLPDSLLTIHSYAFNSCPNLDNIFIPESVQYIGSEVFSNNKDSFKILLGSSTIPSEFDSNFNCYYPYVLGTNRNTKIDDVFVSSSDLNYAINNYQSDTPSAALISSNLQDATLSIPENIKFQSTKTANITSIADHACFNDETIQTLELSNASNLKTIGKYAFANSILSTIKFISNVEYLDSYCFSACENLESIDLSGITKINIGSGAFYYDYNLTDVTLPTNGSFELGTGVFYKCRQLKTLTNLEKAATLNLKGYTFAECYKLGIDSLNPFVFPANIETLHTTDFLDWGTTQPQYIKIAKDAYTIEHGTGDIYLNANDGLIKLETTDGTNYKNNLYFSNAIITLEPQS